MCIYFETKCLEETKPSRAKKGNPKKKDENLPLFLAHLQPSKISESGQAFLVPAIFSSGPIALHPK